MPLSSALAMDRESSSEPATISHQSSAPEPVAFNTSPRRPETIFMRKGLMRRGTEIAKLNKAFLARANSVLALE